MNEIKSHKLTKLSILGLLGVVWSIPCIKIQDTSKRSLLPILNQEINFKLSDNDINPNVIIKGITYDDVSGVYYLSYKIPMNIAQPYTYYFNGSVAFNYTSEGTASIGEYWFNSVSAIASNGQEELFEPSTRLEIQADTRTAVPLVWSIAPSQNDINLQVGYQYHQGDDLVTGSLLDYDIDGGDYPRLLDITRSGSYILNIDALLGDNPSSYQQGVNYGIQYVLEHLSDYNLYTQSDYLQYGVAQYNLGFSAGHDALSLSGLVKEIFASPITMFKGIFNWTLVLPNGEVINVLPIMTFLLTIGIALAIVHLIMKIG